MDNKNYHKKELCEAISNKVKKVLDNTKYMTDATIIIEYHRTEAPSIRYSISELIAAETGGDSDE